MVCRVKLLPQMPTSCMGSGSGPGYSISDSLLADVPGNVAESGPSVWDPASNMRDPGEAPRL